ncbi:MAG TPA: uroporphyrinogen-III synthase [Ramlibacter sp.]|nr:uroporphyrinogen-III synthase [Ramlibacter sp.]
MRVVVTRPAAEAAQWQHELHARGFDAIALPLIDIQPIADASALQQCWARIDSYRAAMFVSANAVRGFFAAKLGRASFTPRAWATGPGTHNALLAAGVAASQIDCPAEEALRFDSESLWESIQAQCHQGGRVLIVRGGEGRDWLEQRLAEKGVAVEAVAAYSRQRPHWTHHERAVAASAADSAWILSSSEAIANLQALLPGQRWDGASAVATHPRIAQAARDAGFGVVCESRPSMPEVIAALESLG